MRLEDITPDNWQEFTGASDAVILLGKTTCDNCQIWSQELKQFLESDERFSHVRFGKMMIDQRGFAAFKKEHGHWLAKVNDLPFNVIVHDGEIQKRYAGGGIDRLVNRLTKVAGESKG